VSGQHIHSDSCKSKNPEIFFIINGNAKFVIRNLETKDEETHEVSEGDIIEIPAGIYHELHALTDFYFMEFNHSKEDFEKQETTRIEK
ncbi:MAG: cupin domain-containing protein, partial [Candidatus Diapherotrites archaeon]|nr:cupin domain-containing protein [Candidatus Diapherotrites archaeon]